MQIKLVSIKNFRLLSDVELVLEDQSTVIVGRNNSGKTSLSEVMRRFLSESNLSFQIEDFSSSCYDEFYSALEAKNRGENDEVVREMIPAIELKIKFIYDPAQSNLSVLSPLIIDLDPDCLEALVVVRYELKDGRFSKFMQGQPRETSSEENKKVFFRELKERIPQDFGIKVWAEDPNDQQNKKNLQLNILNRLVKTGFINAQRGLDDVTSRESDVLAKIVEGLFATASSLSDEAVDKQIAEGLKSVIQDVQREIDGNFGEKLESLMPALKDFGYPGLGGQVLHTETQLDVKKLLSNFTKVRYAGHNGVNLPETYNGLGTRNLIFILFQLAGFYRAFRAESAEPGVHLIFIEEPEAHLHPQMQEVFIKQLHKIAQQLVDSTQDKRPWPVQFIISTHSSHIANAAGFESIRYFLGTSVSGAQGGVRKTKIKDFRKGFEKICNDDKKFLHQYMTLTRCDLFFADKAVLVEGLSERLMLPAMISKFEDAEPDHPKLSNQYMTVMEVGGAYAHLFFELLKFLELRSLIITDLDSVDASSGEACLVHEGMYSSNACLKSWFSADAKISLEQLQTKQENEKVKNNSRIAYQHSEVINGPCGRTFEDAFILANKSFFNMTGEGSNNLEIEAQKLAKKYKKSEFALKYAIEESNWSAPSYILDGIRWLAIEENPMVPDPMLELVSEVALQDRGENNA